MSFAMLRNHVVYDNSGVLYDRATRRRFNDRVISRLIGVNIRNAIAAAAIAFDVPDNAQRVMVLHRDGDPTNLKRANLGVVYKDPWEGRPPLSPWRLVGSAASEWLDWMQTLPPEAHDVYSAMDVDLLADRVDVWFFSHQQAKQFFHRNNPPSRSKPVITPEVLAAVFIYDPQSGDFWLRKDVQKGPIRSLWYPKKLVSSGPYRLRSALAGIDIRADTAAAILNFGLNPLEFTTGRIVMLDGDPTNTARDNVACIVPHDTGGSPYFILTAPLRGEIAVRALLLPEQERNFDRQTNRLDAAFATSHDAVVWLAQCGFTSLKVHGVKGRDEAPPAPEPAPEPLFL